jgi:hypothetical protein
MVYASSLCTCPTEHSKKCASPYTRTAGLVLNPTVLMHLPATPLAYTNATSEPSSVDRKLQATLLLHIRHDLLCCAKLTHQQGD